MAPMTRARSSQPGNVPNDMMATYYQQRASAGLIITEATQISDDSQGYSFTPGIYTDAQIEGWKSVTTAAKAQGAAIFCQLWHVGRVSHPIFQKGELPIAPSALAPTETQVWIADENGNGNMVDCIQPREMTQADIDRVVQDFANSAKKAIEAGFDGVEIHGANGYLIDEFLRRSSNHRTDQYGGSQENRIRFLVEVAEAVAGEIGADRTGIRMSPYITQRNMADEEMIEVMLKAAKELDRIGLVYIHLSEADWNDAPQVPEQFRRDLRAAYSGKIIVAGKYTRDRATSILKSGLADIVAFGRPFIANPDLPRRLAEGLPLAEFDGSLLFGGTRQGYSSYPEWSGAA